MEDLVISVDDITQKVVSAPPSRLPGFLLQAKTLLRNKLGKDGVDPMLKTLLDSASTQLYYDCANKYDYEKLCEALGLPDYMSSWYKLTLLHCWMVLMRMHISLDGYAYLRLKRSMLSAMWFDVDSRLKIVGAELKQTLTTKSDILNMHGLHLQTFLEYDEGFLANDRLLAAALWRCLYLSRAFDPIHVLSAIVYIRSTLAWLDTIDIDDIMVNGIKEWKQIKPKSAVPDTETFAEEIEGERRVAVQMSQGT
ncbi:hypothetical protein KIN20_004194 [Parelaphostrongylus tenuis]|uniref:Ubiquinol-cytochrome c chaperone domain-containing protein n=1 Tax=Parelaphostrongylus tenuis TaxID=148309 RepID=A0AAD5M096_PARTN|nr:hypothetical protein KIN20_004194 [Parelaphostrongylus tenuis]